jgi:hypothetical protein
MKIRVMGLAMLVLLAALPLWAQTSNPSDSNSATGPLKISVLQVQGGAQFRPDAQTKWQALKAGGVFAEGVEFRTGPKGTIQFTVGTDQVYRVDRLTAVKVLRANLGPDGTIRTDVGMEYGRVSKDVDSPVRPHEDTIVSPSSTLAVRGTQVSLYDQPPYEPEAVSLTGAAVFSSLGRQLSAFGAKAQGTAAVTASHPDSANNSIVSSLVDPSTANARTAAEQQLLPDVTTNGAVVSVSNPVTFPTVSDTGMPSYSELAGLYPGNLIFYIRWDSDTHVQMQLQAGQPSGVGEFMLPVLGLNRSAAGGQILFDNLGGPGGGYEVITYPTVPFHGQFNIAATNLGSVSTNVTFDAFINQGDGKGLVPQYFLNNLGNLGNGAAFNTLEVTQTLTPAGTANSSALATATVPNTTLIVLPGGGGGFSFSARQSGMAALAAARSRR